eukprot:c30410_g1_i1 orf=243-1442(+)
MGRILDSNQSPPCAPPPPQKACLPDGACTLPPPPVWTHHYFPPPPPTIPLMHAPTPQFLPFAPTPAPSATVIPKHQHHHHHHKHVGAIVGGCIGGAFGLALLLALLFLFLAKKKKPAAAGGWTGTYGEGAGPGTYGTEGGYAGGTSTTPAGAARPQQEYESGTHPTPSGETYGTTRSIAPKTNALEMKTIVPATATIAVKHRLVNGMMHCHDCHGSGLDETIDMVGGRRKMNERTRLNCNNMLHQAMGLWSDPRDGKETKRDRFHAFVIHHSYLKLPNHAVAELHTIKRESQLDGCSTQLEVQMPISLPTEEDCHLAVHTCAQSNEKDENLSKVEAQKTSLQRSTTCSLIYCTVTREEMDACRLYIAQLLDSLQSSYLISDSPSLPLTGHSGIPVLCSC